jgi:hypothetical protein
LLPLRSAVGVFMVAYHVTQFPFVVVCRFRAAM